MPAPPGVIAHPAPHGGSTFAGTEISALTEADAKRLTMQLKLLFGSVADQIDKIKKLIAQAKSGQADVALGYKSWTAYCETEFAGALPVLERPRPETAA